MRLWRSHESVLLGAAVSLIADQQTVIEDLQAALDQAQIDFNVLVLESRREILHVAAAARLAAEEGRDINHDLDEIIDDLYNSIARMEEHMVVTP